MAATVKKSCAKPSTPIRTVIGQIQTERFPFWGYSLMKIRFDLWEPHEYSYPLAYDFIPNVVAFLHGDPQPRPGIIVVPGGAYCFLSATEADVVAERFFSMGYNTFVLSYTTDLSISCPLKQQPMNDLSRAIRLIRSKASELHVIADQLAICGFSAGGHLCSSICVHYLDIQDLNPVLQQYSNRPDAAILSYPVISSGTYTHEQTMRALFGPNPTSEELDYASNECHVTVQTPPCFLWHTLTDAAVPVENSLLFADACRKHGVTCAMHVFSNGPHGLSTADDHWINESWKADYVMKQSFAILEQIKNGTMKHISSNWLLDAFLTYGKDLVNECSLNGALPNEEVAVWPQLAHSWLQQQFQKGVCDN